MWLRSGAIRPNGRARSPWSIRHGVLRAPNITFISAETTSTGGKGRRFVRVKGALNAAKGRLKPAKPPCLAPKTMAVSQTQGPLCPMSVYVHVSVCLCASLCVCVSVCISTNIHSFTSDNYGLGDPLPPLPPPPPPLHTTPPSTHTHPRSCRNMQDKSEIFHRLG